MKRHNNFHGNNSYQKYLFLVIWQPLVLKFSTKKKKTEERKNG